MDAFIVIYLCFSGYLYGIGVISYGGGCTKYGLIGQGPCTKKNQYYHVHMLFKCDKRTVRKWVPANLVVIQIHRVQGSRGAIVIGLCSACMCHA